MARPSKLSDFDTAAMLSSQGDVDSARSVLQSFIEKQALSTDPKANALCAVARSKIEMLVVQAELRKPANARNLSTLVRGYLRAARASYVRGRPLSFRGRKILAYRAWFLSEVMRWRAFSILRGSMTEALIQKTSHYFFKAIRYAKKAISLVEGEFPEEHIVYLTFWHGAISMRFYLLRYMNPDKGDDVDFRCAKHALTDAISAAERLSKKTGEGSIFPNHYYSLAELKLEEYLLKASKAFRERQWKDCVAMLTSWFEKSPEECKLSWRGCNVKIRLLGTQLIDLFFSHEKKEFAETSKRLYEFSHSQPVGAAAHYFADEVLKLPERSKSRALLDSTLGSLARYFPLEALADYKFWPGPDRFASLPARIYAGIQPSLPSSKADVERLKAIVLGSVEAFLGHLSDYYLQVSSPPGTVPHGDIASLIDECSKLPVEWTRWQESHDRLEALRTAVAEIGTSHDPKSFAVAHDQIRETVFALKRRFPVITEIKSTQMHGNYPLTVESFPDWRLDRVGTERILIILPADVLPSLKVGKYYLRPGWRRGNRLSYPVSDELLLPPVRYEPRWSFWEMEAANAALLVTEGISYEHLRNAIELMKKCKGPANKPKVGAVIVKDGAIQAQAYRSEDGTERHAEEIAIGKCDRDQLRGATMITTLEPCTVHGRSPSVASCSMLLLSNGFSKIIIGTLDPDNRIRGHGDKLLRSNDVTVAYFPSSLAKEIWDLNREFISDRTKDEFRTIRIPKP